MRASLAALAAFLTLAPLTAASAAAAAAAELPVTGDEIRDIARRELLWCEAYDTRNDDCEVVSLLRLRPDGSLSATSTLPLQPDPRWMVYSADTAPHDSDLPHGTLPAP